MKLISASSPHIRSSFRTDRIMLDVVLALLPALAVGIYVHGIRAVLIALVSIGSAVAAEYLFCLANRIQTTVQDCSAIVTGLLLAMTLPVSVPIWLAVTGAVFAILFVKCLCGGLGQNIFNPALAARAFMLLLFPAGMTCYTVSGADAVSSATPLHHMVIPALPEEPLSHMFLGLIPGSIGETSALALLLGGAYLVFRKVITVRIPAAYLGTVAVLTLVFHKTDAPVGWMLYNLLGGGLMLGAIFMATDYSSSPVTAKGQWIYGFGCGTLTVLFRYFGLYPEGVTYAILIMNALSWFFDRHTGSRRFGTGKGGSSA